MTIRTAAPSRTGSSLWRFRSTMSMSSRSKNSTAVGTKGSRSSTGTQSMQVSRLSKGMTRVQVQLGAGISFKVTSVQTHRMPSEPTTRSFTSKPVVFFTTLEEKWTMSPLGMTASIQRT